MSRTLRHHYREAVVLMVRYDGTQVCTMWRHKSFRAFPSFSVALASSSSLRPHHHNTALGNDIVQEWVVFSQVELRVWKKKKRLIDCNRSSWTIRETWILFTDPRVKRASLRSYKQFVPFSTCFGVKNGPYEKSKEYSQIFCLKSSLSERVLK